MVPLPISVVLGADGPHAVGVDRGILRIYTSDFDGFLRECPFAALFVVFGPVSLPSTDDARLWREDHDESRKSAAPREEEEAFDDPFQAKEDASFRLRLLGCVTREGCFMGSGEVPRDDSGEGVAPRDRVVPTSAERVVERPDVKGWESW